MVGGKGSFVTWIFPVYVSPVLRSLSNVDNDPSLAPGLYKFLSHFNCYCVKICHFSEVVVSICGMIPI